MSSSIGTGGWMRPSARWLQPAHSQSTLADLGRALNIPPFVASVLATRGFTDPVAAAEFLSPSLEQLHDPLLLTDLEIAVGRLQTAIRQGESILIYGDYDVDGTASIVILKKAIEILGGTAEFHIPHRVRDGYGMRSDVIAKAAESGIRLIISVDTGIRALEVVRHARAIGIDVIVTDHHLPDEELPPALAVLNPNRRDCRYPFKDLCGAGVTFKLVQALIGRSNLAETRQRALLDSFLKPVAIATVADIVPLTGENRTIVRRGLSGLRDVRNPGLRSLLRVAGFEDGDVPSAHQVGFRLAPRINAAGRMATARDVVELFLTPDEARAQQLAEQLDVLNRERQQVEAEIVETVLQQCESLEFDLAGLPALVFAGEGWHPGVLGIVASRLVERFCRPVFVLSDGIGGDGQPCLTGSGRSIRNFHLLEALESMPELFTRFGGHRQAAGLTMLSGGLDEFRRRFALFATDQLTEDDLRPQFQVDGEICFADLTDTSIGQVLGLGPFGCGNPTPIFLASDVEVAGPPKVLKEGKHLSIPLRQKGRVLFVKAWNFGERQAEFEAGRRLDLLVQVEDDPYSRKRGYGSWCLTMKDVRPSQPGS